MPRHKTPQNCKFVPWLTGKKTQQGSGRFNQIDNSWYLHPAVKSLSGNAYKLYQSMTIEAGGKPSVEFSRSAGEKYGISSTTFDRAIKELITKGFIEMRAEENLYKYRTNVYRFCDRWK